MHATFAALYDAKARYTEAETLHERAPAIYGSKSWNRRTPPWPRASTAALTALLARPRAGLFLCGQAGAAGAIA